MNIENLRTLADAIKADPEHSEQDEWFRKIDGDGTDFTMCAAARASVLAGAVPDFGHYNSTSMVTIGGVRRDCSNVAAEWLGLHEDWVDGDYRATAHVLFYEKDNEEVVPYIEYLISRT